MKTLLKILLIVISGSLAGCNSGINNKSEDSADESSTTTMPPDSMASEDKSSNSANYPDPGDFERETLRQITANLLSSGEEISRLKSDVSDSLSRTITPEKKLLFSKTMLELEDASEVINKQLEQIIVKDLVSSREKLSGIIRKMRSSEKEMINIINRLDKVCGYMQVATTLFQSLVPSPLKTTPSKSSNNDK